MLTPTSGKTVLNWTMTARLRRVIQASAIPRECSVRTSSCLQVSSCNGWPTGDVSSATSITSRNLCASSRSNNAGLVSPARPPGQCPPEFAGIRRNRHSHVGRPDGVAGTSCLPAALPSTTRIAAVWRSVSVEPMRRSQYRYCAAPVAAEARVSTGTPSRSTPSSTGCTVIRQQTTTG